MNQTQQGGESCLSPPTAEQFQQLVAITRSCRRFREDTQISNDTLCQLIEMARLSGSARNGQPWQYMIVNDPRLCGRIFPHIGWAGYLRDWKGPDAGERPAAYILCLLNRNWLKVSEKEAFFDLGIASQSMLLGAAARNIMGCRIGSFSPKVNELFTLPEHLNLALIIAIGEPVERIVLEETENPEAIAYWRDEQHVHHVPKRPLQDLIITLETR